MFQPLLIHSWPQAIIHVDADAFFASCEQALHPEYKGKPVITGKERGIVACPSYEAKAKGIKRGMRFFEARSLCPECIFLPSDYETYSLFSKRMFSILRGFTPQVEEYSIDEGFADVTGLRRPLNSSYKEIALKIKKEIENQLGITVSLGLSLNKSLCKIASKRKKPAGFTVVPGRIVHLLLADTPLDKVWGFGPNISAHLRKLGLKNALDFAQVSPAFAKKHLGKIGEEIRRELRGEMVYPLIDQEKSKYASISKMRTFTPPKSDFNFIKAQIIRNLESACIKARRHKLLANQVILFLRTQEFSNYALKIKLTHSSAYPLELAPIIAQVLPQIFNPQKNYRTSGVVLADLQANSFVQEGLFNDPVKIAKFENISQVLDKINQKFGKHTLHLASSLLVDNYSQHLGERGHLPLRKEVLFPTETKRQRLNLPVFFAKVV